MLVFWGVAGLSVMLEVIALSRQMRNSGLLNATLWYLPDPPDFWSLVRSVWQAWHCVDFADCGTSTAVETSRIGAIAFFRLAAGQLAKARRSSPGLCLIVLAETLASCAATVSAVYLAWTGSVGAEYVLVAIWSLQMGRGHLRMSTGKSALIDHQGWFKRHGWVHAWWMPLMLWVRLAVILFPTRVGER